MGQAIGGSLPLALGVALSPVAIIAVVLMLTSRRAKVNGPVFVLGWLIGLAVRARGALAAGGGARVRDRADRRPGRAAGHRLPGLRPRRHPRRRHPGRVTPWPIGVEVI